MESNDIQTVELKTKIDYLTRDVNDVKIDVNDVKIEVSAVHDKLNENSTKIFDYILAHTERMEERYLSKDSFKMRLWAIGTWISVILYLIFKVQ